MTDRTISNPRSERAFRTPTSTPSEIRQMPASGSDTVAADVHATTDSRIPLLLACGGSFLAFIDATVANLALPALARDFGGVGITTLPWVVTLYTILFAALLAPAGRFADALGRRRLYAVGVATFTVASLLAAIAPRRRAPVRLAR